MDCIVAIVAKREGGEGGVGKCGLRMLVFLQRSKRFRIVSRFDGALVPKNDCLGGGCIPCQQKENPGAVSNGLRGA